QPQSLQDARAGGVAAHRRAVHSDLRRVHLPEGPARARRPDGVPSGALPALQPAARPAARPRGLTPRRGAPVVGFREGLRAYAGGPADAPTVRVLTACPRGAMRPTLHP